MTVIARPVVRFDRPTPMKTVPFMGRSVATVHELAIAIEAYSADGSVGDAAKLNGACIPESIGRIGNRRGKHEVRHRTLNRNGKKRYIGTSAERFGIELRNLDSVFKYAANDHDW